jgi:hypothetical protein
VGFLLSFGIQAESLESEEWDVEEGSPNETDNDDEEHDAYVRRP